MLPAPGEARLIIVNGSEEMAVLTINKREYKIAAGAGADDPQTAINWGVKPGNYTVKFEPPGEQGESVKLTLRADETWGVIINPAGGFAAVQLVDHQTEFRMIECLDQSVL